MTNHSKNALLAIICIFAIGNLIAKPGVDWESIRRNNTIHNTINSTAMAACGAGSIGWSIGLAQGMYRQLYHPEMGRTIFTAATRNAPPSALYGLLAAPFIYEKYYGKYAYRDSYGNIPSYGDIPVEMTGASFAGGVFGATVGASAGIMSGTVSALRKPERSIQNITRAALKAGIRRIPAATIGGVALGTAAILINR